MRVCKERCVLVPPRRPGDSQKAPGRLVGCPRSDPSSVICCTHHLPFTSPQDPAPSARKRDMMRLPPEPSSKGCMESQCPVNSRIALRMPFTPTELQLVDARLCVCVCVLSRSVTSNSLQPHGLPGTSVHGDAPGKNTHEVVQKPHSSLNLGCWKLLEAVVVLEG